MTLFRPTPRVDAALQQLKDIFLEQPLTELTVADACRMTHLEHSICDHILGALEDVRFVRQRSDGVFIRHLDRPDLSGGPYD